VSCRHQFLGDGEVVDPLHHPRRGAGGHGERAQDVVDGPADADTDPVLVGEFLEPQPPAAREPMPRRERDVERIAQQRDDVVAKVGGKIFAFLGGGGLGVKCGRDSDEAAELRHRYPEHVTVMAYIGRHGWNSVRLDGTIPDEELRELVDESYDAIVAKLPKRLRP
jgi:predicted DNA-binding protein (MmcQ/YjbR family)